MTTEWAKRELKGKVEASGAEAKPAATAAVLRDGEEGLEVLMVQRATKLEFHGGAWVFPGGRIDDVDREPGDVGSALAAARRAAARETREEAGIDIDADALVHISNWTTPDISPKRFATWFFAGPARDGAAEVVADGVESDAVRWITPEGALAERAAGAIELAPPQYVTLLSLSRFSDVEEALTVLDAEEPIDFAPRFCFLDGGGAVCLYVGDVAWTAPEPSRLMDPGPRHRLLMGDAGWIYEQSV
jgi:8-oxo-dGTP pyrophosphatase MutT (NUDIX family)